MQIPSIAYSLVIDIRNIYLKTILFIVIAPVLGSLSKYLVMYWLVLTPPFVS